MPLTQEDYESFFKVLFLALVKIVLNSALIWFVFNGLVAGYHNLPPITFFQAWGIWLILDISHIKKD